MTHPAVGYCVRIEPDGPCRYEIDNVVLGEDEDEKTVRMDEDYTARMKPTVELRPLYASVRPAAIIEEAVTDGR